MSFLLLLKYQKKSSSHIIILSPERTRLDLPPGGLELITSMSCSFYKEEIYMEFERGRKGRIYDKIVIVTYFRWNYFRISGFFEGFNLFSSSPVCLSERVDRTLFTFQKSPSNFELLNIVCSK